MADKVQIQYVGTHTGKKVGETESVDPETARQLLTAGVAIAATVPDAKKAGTDPDEAKTKR